MAMFNSAVSEKKEVVREARVERGERVETVIGEKSAFEGKIMANGAIRIDGAFKGDVDAHGHVTVGEKGLVKGTVTAVSLTVAGRIEGTVNINEHTEILASGIVKGDIRTGHLTVARGGKFDGKCVMESRPAEAAPTAGPAEGGAAGEEASGEA
ncbi:MAG: polymer-forming cytoskeletal protein [Bacillota bacterium]|nr:polymer-forming cytoskeletal protein [Bacillota bacterium]